jgi:hypothetical protein
MIPMNALRLNQAPSKLYGLNTVSVSGFNRRSQVEQ